jgi:hypothetical protein
VLCEKRGENFLQSSKKQAGKKKEKATQKILLYSFFLSFFLSQS